MQRQQRRVNRLLVFTERVGGRCGAWYALQDLQGITSRALPGVAGSAGHYRACAAF